MPMAPPGDTVARMPENASRSTVIRRYAPEDEDAAVDV
ncbi:hypothetical protein GA0115261_107684 [Streptomyces sp. OspMP-M43]|nr:hypothetical protein GA0115261_107684 [Streptomyces sp. OspMP-M43]